MGASRNSVVGSRIVRHDAVDKAGGVLVYASDYFPRGTLVGRVLHAQHPSARIRRIDKTAALSVPGVVCVLTADDVPQNEYVSGLPGRGSDAGDKRDQAVHQILVRDRVRYLGEPVALVAAETEAAADQALERIVVDYESLPGVFDPIDALRPDAPEVHEGGNLLCRWAIRKGDIAAGFDRADVVVENTYRTQFVDHAYLETETGVAWVDENQVINIRVGTQVLEHYRDVARALKLPDSKVRILCPSLGGGFGGKEDVTVEVFLGILAWKTGRPVRLEYKREESILAHAKRHPFVMRCKTGATRDGRLTALEADLIGDSGAYAYLSVWVVYYVTFTVTGPYRIPNVWVDGRAAYTNNPISSAFRCFGSLQSNFASESQMDALARELGMDPLKVREINYLRKGDGISTGDPVRSEVEIAEAVRRCQGGLEASGLRSEGAPSPPPRADKGKTVDGGGKVLTGRAVAASFTPYGRMHWTHDTAQAWVGFEMDASIVIRAGAPDLGGGQASSLVSIASEVLGVDPVRITVQAADSQLTPLSGTTTASRQLTMSGNAVLKSSREILRQLKEVAGDLLEAPPEEVEVADGRAFVRAFPEREVELATVVRRMAATGRPLGNLAQWNAPAGDPLDPETGQGRAVNDYTFGAIGAEVAVDRETGEVQVRRMTSCFDVGRAINRTSVEGQMEGAAYMGLGQGLMEEIIVWEGVTETSNLETYLLPTSLDTPDVGTQILESESGVGPFGAKGIGEPALTPASTAVALAVADAVGMPFRELPITPERVLAALEATKKCTGSI
ncbi:MAG: xanthine dehydrogenase family protein molybdopterin-binding subunit [Nitrospinota bacterium]|nr:xanthine dehydrogenase family protein molybdopterin-binding subunit [Nitrospinota bacterium]